MNDEFMKHIDSKGVYRGPEVLTETIYACQAALQGVKSFGTLKVLKGDLLCESSLPVPGDLGDLVKVKGAVMYQDSNLESLGKLKTITEACNLKGNRQLASLGALEKVGESLFLTQCPILETIGALKSVGGTIFIEGTEMIHEFIGVKFEELFINPGDTGFTNYTLKEFKKSLKEIDKTPVVDLINLHNNIDEALKPLVVRRLKGE